MSLGFQLLHFKDIYVPLHKCFSAQRDLGVEDEMRLVHLLAPFGNSPSALSSVAVEWQCGCVGAALCRAALCSQSMSLLRCCLCARAASWDDRRSLAALDPLAHSSPGAARTVAPASVGLSHPLLSHTFSLPEIAKTL